jgi:hypothetical protein
MLNMQYLHPDQHGILSHCSSMFPEFPTDSIREKNEDKESLSDIVYK